MEAPFFFLPPAEFWLTSKWAHTLLLKMNCEVKIQNHIQFKFKFQGPCHSQFHRLASREARNQKVNFLIWNFTMWRHRSLRRKRTKNWWAHNANCHSHRAPRPWPSVLIQKRSFFSLPLASCQPSSSQQPGAKYQLDWNNLLSRQDKIPKLGSSREEMALGFNIFFHRRRTRHLFCFRFWPTAKMS